MSEMVERVAKALLGISWDSVGAEMQEHFTSQARAAIEAIREPTDGMLNAAWSASPHGIGANIAIAAWHAMIDEALK